MWQELKFRVSSENALLVEEKLFSSGAAAVTFLDARNQPIFVEETDQTPLWEDICIVSLFSQDVNLDTVVDNLVHNPPAIDLDDIETHLVNDQDWENKWMNDQKHGKGIFYYQDDSKYVGHYKKDKRSG